MFSFLKESLLKVFKNHSLPVFIHLMHICITITICRIAFCVLKTDINCVVLTLSFCNWCFSFNVTFWGFTTSVQENLVHLFQQLYSSSLYEWTAPDLLILCSLTFRLLPNFSQLQYLKAELPDNIICTSSGLPDIDNLLFKVLCLFTAPSTVKEFLMLPSSKICGGISHFNFCQSDMHEKLSRCCLHFFSFPLPPFSSNPMYTSHIALSRTSRHPSLFLTLKEILLTFHNHTWYLLLVFGRQFLSC